MRTAAAHCLLFATLLVSVPRSEDALCLEEARGTYLRHLQERRLEPSAEALASLEGRVDPSAAGELDLDRGLLERLRAAFASLADRVTVGERFPTSLGKTPRIRGTVQAADAEGFTIVDRGKETRLRWEELDWGDVGAFLAKPGGAEAEGVPDPLLAGWILVLAGDPEAGWRAIEEAGDEAGALLGARESIERALKEAAALAVLDAGPDRVVELALGGGLEPGLLETATYRRRRADLAPMVRAALESRFDREGIREVLKGSVAASGGGALKISYGFASAAEIEDWEVGTYAAIQHGPWPSEVATGDEAQAHDWRVEGGALAGAGTAVARHRATFSGPIALSFSVTMKPFEKGKKKDPAVDHLFLPGILDNGKGHYLTAQSGNHLYWIAGTRPVDLGEPIAGTPAILFNKEAKVRLEWKDGTAQAFVNGAKCGESEFREMTVGGVFLFLKGPVTMRIDDLTIEGTLEPQWLARERDAWIEGALARALP